MKKILIIILAIHSGLLISQDSILTEETLFPFIIKVDSLNNEFVNLQKQEYYSIQQSNADYIRIITKNPDRFIEDIKENIHPEKLLSKYDNSVIDKNVFITKTKNTNYKEEEFISFQSYEIKSNRYHSIKIAYDQNTFEDTRQSGKYFYDKYYSKRDSTTRIEAFYILNDFKSIKLNPKVSHSIDYADLIIGKERIFVNQSPSVSPVVEFNPIDSLVNFFNSETKKPKRKKEEKYKEFNMRLNKWNEQKEILSDSIFISNKSYRNLIKEAIHFAKEAKSSNSFLEHLCDRYISKYESLNLMRLSSKRGKQSFDSSPINQQIRICKTSAELSNWDVFIKSLINIMNDNMSRLVDNSRVRASRKTYFSEIEKLPIDLELLLIGISLKVNNSKEYHYWGSGDRIGKSIANSKHTKNLIKACIKIIQDKDIDQFNKLHFYNILLNVSYFSKSDEIKTLINDSIQENLIYFDKSIRLRIIDPHLELKNLLLRDSTELETHFDIKTSVIGNLTTSYTSGRSWIGEFKPKNYKPNIFFDVIMKADTTLNSIKDLTLKKDSMISLILRNKIFNEFIHNDTSSISIKYIIDKSYTEKARCCNQEIPKPIYEKYKSKFETAIMLDTNKGKKRAKWIVFDNGDALITQMSNGFNLEKHDFDKLMTIEKDKSFGRSDYYSFKVFNEQGSIIE